MFFRRKSDPLLEAQATGARVRGIFTDVIGDLNYASDLAGEAAAEADRTVQRALARRVEAEIEIEQNARLRGKIEALVA